jgi:tyrocidine synthetase-3
MEGSVIFSLDEFKSAEKYWLDKLTGELSRTVLFYDRPASGDYIPAQYTFSFDKELADRCLRVSKGNDLSLFIVLLTFLKIVTAKCANSGDVIVAAPVLHKEHSEYNRFVALRSRVAGDSTYKEFLLEVRQTVISGFENEYYPLADIMKKFALDGDEFLYRTAIFLENIHDSHLTSQLKEMEENDLALGFKEEQGEITCTVFYNGALFDDSTIRVFASALMIVGRRALEDTAIPLDRLSMVDEEEKERVMKTFNTSMEMEPTNEPLFRLFQAQAEQTPQAPALFLDGETCGYGELDLKSGQLAAYLRANGFKTGDVAALILESSFNMIAAMLGVMKAGGSYLPIDPDYPAKRIDAVLDDCRPAALIISSEMESLYKELSSHPSIPAAVNLDRDPVFGGKPLEADPNIGGDSPAYLIYTSGTTGTPKGVSVPHRGIVNYARWRIRAFELGVEDKALQPLSYSFDGYCSNLYSTLLSGGELVMVPDSRRLDFKYMKELVVEKRITNVSLVPSMFQVLSDHAADSDFSSLRFVVLAGETCTPELLSLSRKKAPAALLANEYGPTEASVTAVAHLGISMEHPNIIGTPIANTRVYVLDPHGHPAPAGIPGQLCIAGTGLAKGYFGDSQLTAGRFFDDPVIGERIYRSGDMARWRQDGTLEFIGRLDSQVKIRGNRIELGDIQARLLQYDAVKEAVVITKEDLTGDSTICAYFVTAAEVETAELREFLYEGLPDYMVPAHLMRLEAMPLTVSGKIDRRALPDIDVSASDKYEAPRDKEEKTMVGIWADILGIEAELVGIDTNFFELGGNSLKATVMVSRIQKELHVDLPIAAIFETPRIRQLAVFIRKSEKVQEVVIEPAPEKEYYAASSAQKRIFIVQQMDPQSITYNMPAVHLLEGTFDSQKFSDTFLRLMRRHESLRTSFHVIDNEVMQKVHPDTQFQLERYEVEVGLPEEEHKQRQQQIIRNFIRPWNLEAPPLFRVGLVKLGPASHILMVDMHHIISDGISQEIFVKEYITLYSGGQLEELTLQYKDFSEWQNQLIESGDMKRQEDYWLDLFKGEIKHLEIPTDYPRPERLGFSGDSIIVDVEPELLGRVKQYALKKDITLNILLLAVYKILLAKFTGMDEILVGIPIAGRRHVDLQDIIGIFVNMLVLRTWPRGDKPFDGFLSEVKTSSLEAYENQDYQFEELVRQLGLQPEAGRQPLVDTVFVFQDDIMYESQEAEQAFSGLKIVPYTMENPVSHFDLMFRVMASPNSMKLHIEYSYHLFKGSTIRDMMQYYQEILQQVVSEESIEIDDIKLMHQFQEARSVLAQDDEDDWGI